MIASEPRPVPAVAPALLVFEAHLETCLVPRAGDLELSGWVLERGGARFASIEIELDGKRVGGTDALVEHPDWRGRLEEAGLNPEHGAPAGLDPGRSRRCRWQCGCRIPAPVSRSSAVLLVRLQSDLGAATEVFRGSLEEALYLTAASGFARHARRAQELEQVIVAIEQSRFWKLRERWLAVKRRLGLTDER